MPTNQQRRDAERRRLQKQLAERREREIARQRFTLITSIVGTLVVIAAIVAVIIVVVNKGDNTKNTARSAPTSPAAASPTPTAAASTAAPLAAPAACVKPTKAASASFLGVTVGAAVNLKHEPKVTSTSTLTPKALECADLVVGTGKPATATSTVSVQYTGVLYKNGTKFDSSWGKAGQKPVSFSLAQVVPGFTQGIGGTGKVAPMRVGGRRIMILPAALGYGAQANGPIPANSALVFVVDLVKVS